ncbi:TonB-dependent receptor [Elizabethkingia argenteiflava]|uniref:TonB-dependent receptor n=1 Tax=Elizabethkingia argenteiflava TaxID=2681556 RepID=UPI001FCEBA5A|nr:TonB-dependent receptor [Elizabethkingia argenteiflava]
MFLLFWTGAGLQAQALTGGLSGKVTMVDGQPLPSISVSLQEMKLQTLTDDKGVYRFQNLNEGRYIVKFQILGIKEILLPVEVVAGKITILDYQLPKENILSIQEVVLVKNNLHSFSKKESVYVARLPLKNMENPQVYTSVSKELFQEQMAIDLGGISKNVPGAGIPMIANQGRVTFRSRGFQAEPNARNGVAGAAFSVIDPVNLERIEAIKGPSATLFGKHVSGGYGGVYNRVTKKPYNGFGGEVGYVGGSWSYNRLTVDFNRPINKERTALFRLNSATTYEKSFQDSGFTNSLAIAPSFSYQINDRLSLLLDVEFNQAKGTSVVRFNPYRSKKVQSIANMNFPYYKNFLGDDLAYETQMMNIFGQLNYKISEHWTSQTIMSRARSVINGYISAINGKTDSTASAQVMVGTTAFMATNLQQNFIGDFYIGRFRNRLLIGLDYYNNSNHFDRYHTQTKAFNFVHPSTDFRVNRNIIDALTATSTVRKEKNSDNTYAAYVSEVFNVNDQFILMASLRIDRFQFKGVYNIMTGETKGGLSSSGSQAGPYGQTAFSPKLGIVYQVLSNKLSLFGNYMSGFNNVSGSDINGNSFKPEYANQMELGMKADLFDHKLVGTFSFYNIKVDNVLRSNPEDVNYSIQDGSQLSKGIEVELTVNPFKGFNVVAGYAYNDSKYTRANPSVNNLRPALSGPDNIFNFWVSYRLSQGKLKGLGIGIGGNVGSASYQTNTQTAKVIIPSYSMFDAGVFYDQLKYRIGFKVDNMTNEKAWSVRLTPQAPARFLGSFALKF